ncbi:phenylalanine--tRNA ligase subunit alpha [Magnetofaba australis]|uniref:Phenylalanine--tRNA ligase alpha subunit n=1 Tax=Magnetofaba australis IT-1 TaxID=1434232 RepID=A0A1Y2K4Q3_9PROT|nr:phenylalanine--tRNA ligase subunit alpha [Magnetofaba australis]OSM02104.1 putative phenylalanyl-tRNA synthetase subunit alpha [Magnetofaba australis IT-1]
MKQIPELDFRILDFLSQQEGLTPLDQIVAALQLDQSQVAAVTKLRAEAGELVTEERVWTEYGVGKKAKGFDGGILPERRILKTLMKLGREAEIPAVAEVSGLDAKEVGQSLRWLKQKGWMEQKGKTLAITDAGEKAFEAWPEALDDEKLFKVLWDEGGWLDADALTGSDVDLDAALKALNGRGGVVDLRERKAIRVGLSEAGRAMMADGVQPVMLANQLTPDMLRDGSWRNYQFRPYDVTLDSFKVAPGKVHPLIRMMEKTRRVFLEMGFEEIESGYVDSSFWVFDALFQPQDHPAREMQDTFYVSNPGICDLPEGPKVEAVRATHENGGETGSIGWRYDWSARVASTPVLRTHTTAATIRALGENPNPPRKIFCVGPVFRRETVDYKHLPMFHQVEGVVVDKEASFAQLLGILKVFYGKMGFDKLQFRPAYFPYTEPSVEIFVWLEGKQDWVELGGAGMFRPEVTEPMGCQTPVLAWGLGLERLAMISYGLSNLSQLYQARLNWLEEESLCP